MSLPTIILLPVFEDWQAVTLLLPRVLASVQEVPNPAVLIVDDGSRHPPPGDLARESGGGFAWVRVLRLKRNVGHQRAIAVGLSYIDEHVPCEAVVVMDADGEDRPEDVPRLLARARDLQGERIVFAERGRRIESVFFRVCYHLYRALHRLLTGADVRVGNFSVIPRGRLASVVVTSELWIHYAASTFRARQPVAFVQAARGQRLAGPSRMSFVGLVVHGLSAISVYSDVVFTRLVVTAGIVAAVAIVSLCVGLGVYLWDGAAVPGWLAYSAALLLVIVFQAMTFVAALTFLILGSRQQATFIPRRDYATFVQSLAEPAPGAAPRV
jgi:polyisoprenyl-phosphate glycosyltransferase